MTLVNQPSENIKAVLARQLSDAVRVADAYAGRDPVARFRAHADFDFSDVISGELLHDIECPYCRVRKLKRAYGLALHMEGKSHDKITPH
jgi:hypothetical protein